MEDVVRDGSPEDSDHNQDDVRPIAAFRRKLGAVNVHKSNSTTQEFYKDTREKLGRVSELGDTMENELVLKKQIIVHGQEGPYTMDADKWPRFEDPNVLVGDSQLTQEEDLMETGHTEEVDSMSDEEEDTQGWVVQTAKKKKRKISKKKGQTVVETRASTRVPRDGVPIAAKAMARAKEKNDLQKGTSSNPFTILNNAPTVHLRNVMLDLDLACDDINSQINTFRAEEIVRANLAEANYSS
jgi:hypothetical protein